MIKLLVKNYVVGYGLLLLFVLSLMLYTGCKKPDSTAPEVTLNGDANPIIPIKGTYVEEGATASDNKDGEITPTHSGTVNPKHAGVYVITYRAIDAAGNIGTATRTVTVRNDAYLWAGHYNCTYDTVNYEQYITASDTANNWIYFSRFSNHAYNSYIHAVVWGTALVIPVQLAIQVGTPPADRTFSGSGSSISNGFTLNYTESISGSAVVKTETFTRLP
jgi:hypothetical protein